jgi:hypothetical protein
MTSETADDIQMPDELQILKDRAKLMGITHSNNIGLEALRAKIVARQAENDQPLNHGSAEDAANNPLGESESSSKPLSIRERLLRDEMKLIRLRITNLDPKKKDLPGEIYTIANEYLGTVRKYVPFGETTEDGYHVPHCIYTFLKNKKFLNVRTTKAPNGSPVVKHNMAPEFALEVLPALTQDELNKLANAQKAAGVFNNDEQF